MALRLLLLAAGMVMVMAHSQWARAGDADRPGGAFNLRIVSDSTPDFSSRENFVYSALSPWPSDAERSLAQWRWVHRSRRVGTFVPEDSRPVLDPVLFFNSYGITYCSMISEINCSLWEARGLGNRVVHLNGHVVSEVFYDNAWHMFDNDFCNYFLNEKGQVASAEELKNSRVHGNIADLANGEFYLFDHCPAASTPRGWIFMGPSSASLIEVARDWWRPDKVHVNTGFTGSHAGHRYVLGLLPGQRYTRHWQPLGTGEKFARPFPNGKDPADATVLKNSRANGQWVWDVELTNPDAFFELSNAVCEAGQLKLIDPKEPGYAVLRMSAANVVTSATVRADCENPLRFEVSTNAGKSWQPVNDVVLREGVYTAQLPDSIAGRLEYLLKIDLAGGPTVRNLRLSTVTQVNPRALPALRLGANHLVAVSDGHYETMTFNPRLSGEQAAGEVFDVTGYQGIRRPTESQPSVHSTGGDASVTLRGRTPRAIQSVRMAATQLQPEGGAEFFMEASFDGGRNWSTLRHDYFAGWPADHRSQARLTTDKLPTPTREARLRYRHDVAGCGLVNVFAEIHYAPAGGFMPYEIAYAWQEWHDGRWVDRGHVERVAGPYHRYAITVGGTRPPRMVSVALGPISRQPGGYSGPAYAGEAKAPSPYRLELGTLLSKHRPYVVSRPASAAFPDVGGKLLTDGVFGVSSFWGLDGITLNADRSDRRVGDLVVWPGGEPVTVTIDLGQARTVGGVRVCALQPNKDVLYPERIEVETSQDGKAFSPAGEVGWEACFFPPSDSVQWEGSDSPVYAALPAGGILDYRFPIIFSQPVEARYVRVRLARPAGRPEAAVSLWEVEVYDRITRTPGGEPIALPIDPASRPRP